MLSVASVYAVLATMVLGSPIPPISVVLTCQLQMKAHLPEAPRSFVVVDVFVEVSVHVFSVICATAQACELDIVYVLELTSFIPNKYATDCPTV